MGQEVEIRCPRTSVLSGLQFSVIGIVCMVFHILSKVISLGFPQVVIGILYRNTCKYHVVIQKSV